MLFVGLYRRGRGFMPYDLQRRRLEARVPADKHIVRMDLWPKAHDLLLNSPPRIARVVFYVAV